MTTYFVAVYVCPACRIRFSAWSVGSCNTFGATMYTDGCVDGPMYEEGNAVLLCPGCGQCLWREDLTTLASVRDVDYMDDPSMQDLARAIRPQRAQYRDLLNQRPWTSVAREKYIRIRAWWASNDDYRAKRTKALADDDDARVANMERLLEILDPEDTDEALTMAELHRELGRFDDCVRQLDRPFDEDLRHAADAIRRLAEKRVRRVAVLK